MKLTPREKIVKAADEHRGLRLTWEEVWMLRMDDALVCDGDRTALLRYIGKIEAVLREACEDDHVGGGLTSATVDRINALIGPQSDAATESKL